MKLNNCSIYLFLFLSMVFTGCVDDNIGGVNNTPPNIVAGEGETLLDVFVNDFNDRTRDIDFSDGATVRLNTVWIGVFDLLSGKCVEKQHTGQDYALATSGIEGHGVIRIQFNGPELPEEETDEEKANHNFFIVAVANYQDVFARTSDDIEDDSNTLADLLDAVENWDDFNKIGVETESAYNGDHSLDSPLLAGFLNNKSAYNAAIPSSTHIKVNQFAGTGVKLLPEKLVNETRLTTALTVKYRSDLKRYVAVKSDGTLEDALNHTIFFRRLIANINVNITSEDPIIISEVSFRRFNIPQMVYIIERSLVDPTTKQFPSDANLSPNFADLNPSLGYYNDDDKLVTSDSSSNSEEDSDGISGVDEENGAYSEPEGKNWKTDNVSQNDDGSWTFSFQHFANKHWARNNPQNYIQRETILYEDPENGGYPYFSALANNSLDFNNNASYFAVKMHLINKEKNRCAEAEYTIHEGYTSDENGYASSDATTRLKDFSTARNINYNYNIKVHSFENIIFNVTGTSSDGVNITDHRSDYKGSKVWQMNYANEPKDVNCNSIEYRVKYHSDIDDYTGAINNEGGIFLNALRIDNDEPNLAFRLYGYNSAESSQQIEGYNYNFPDNSFKWLNGLWPQTLGPKSRYFKDYDALIEAYNNDNPINNLLFETFHFIASDNYNETRENVFFDPSLTSQPTDKNVWLDIVQLIKSVNEMPDRVQKNYHMKVEERRIQGVPQTEKEKYIRAIYIADRKGQIDNTDGCSTLVNVYAAVQDPPLYNLFQASPVFKNEMYNNWKNSWNIGKTAPEDIIFYSNTSANGNWTGNINGIVNLGFHVDEDLNARGYKVYIFKSGEPSIAISEQIFNNKTKDSNGYVELPLKTNWNGVTKGSYDIVLSLVDPSSNDGNNPIRIDGKLILTDPVWNFSDEYWQKFSTIARYTSIFGITGTNINRGTATSPKYYSIEKNFFMENNGLELGVFELSGTSPIINAGGYLYTIADYEPTSPTGILNMPTNGKSFQLKLKVSKSANLKIEMINTKTDNRADGKVLTVQLGSNLSGNVNNVSKPENGVVNYNDNTYTYTHFPTSKSTISFPVNINDSSNSDAEANEITIGLVKWVGWIYTIKYE